MKLSRIFVAGSLALVATAASASVAVADETATVSMLHGVPGATVDVYANGEALLTAFEPGTLTDPQELPAGTYDLKVVAAGAGADGEAVIEANGVTVPALENPNEAMLDIAPGTVSADVVAAGTDTVVRGQLL